MLIEINGAGFANKGAQLMLETVIDRFRSQDPATRFAVAAARDRPPLDVGTIGAEFIWPSASLIGKARKFKPVFVLNDFISRFVNDKRLRPYGLVSRRQVDALIDVSGYAFGDRWGTQSIRNMTTLTRFYKRRNKPVVLLPQMLGPFEKSDVKSRFISMAGNCDLIFARDKTSFAHATKVAPQANIRIAPDITIFSKADQATSDSVNLSQGCVCLVPNIRVLDSSDWQEEAYLEAFVQCASVAQKAGRRIWILIHDRVGPDAELAKKLQVLINNSDVEIFTDSNPKVLKQFIGHSRLVIGSRFHSLVAALSSNVPCIAIGWAHKYSELLGDYQQSKFNIAGPGEAGNAPALVAELMDDQLHSSNENLIRETNRSLGHDASKMWDQVFELLNLSRVEKVKLPI